MSGLTAAVDAERGLKLRGAIQAMRETETVPMCSACRDTGMVITGSWATMRVARECFCGVQRAAERRLQRAGVPERYKTATFDTLRTAGMDPSVGMAARMARELATVYPFVPEGRGLLLHGTCGTGKTHLATAVLRCLVTERAASGKFWDLGDLLATLKRSYGNGAGNGSENGGSETAWLDELAAVDVLVLDELGAQRLTDWSMETVSLILGQRYNGRGVTVLTTNYPNLPAGAGKNGAETLGDRIGTRMWSRLQEMTRPLEMVGADFRLRMTAAR